MADVLPFDLPFNEAIAFFRAKGVQLSPESWRDVFQAANARAFTVARVTQMDVLQDIRKGVDKAKAEGTSLSEFKKSLIPLLQQKGWFAPAGEKATIAMPDGTVRKRLTPWRLETVYRTNLQTAYSVGRYKQQMEVATARPYWQYKAVLDSRTRFTHAAQNDKVYDFRHPFWSTWYPPNGFNCFPPGTRISTPGGWRSIENICVQDRVIGGGGQEKCVTAVHMNRFDGEMIGLIFEGGRINATPNHRVLTMRGWVRADLIQTGDILVQTAETPLEDALVGDVYHADSKGRNRSMAFPAQGEPAEMLALDGKVERGDENIEPARPQSCGDDMVVKRSERAQMIEKDRFGMGGVSLAGDVSGRIALHNKPMRSRILSPDLRPSGRGGLLEFYRRPLRSFIRFFGLPESRMAAIGEDLPHACPHNGAGLFAAPFGGMKPLSANGVTPSPGLDTIVSEQPHKCSGIDLPPLAKLPVGKLFVQIETGEDSGKGAPLNCFDSLDDFAAWAWLHAHLHQVISCEKLPYNGIVYNLSVAGDASYIVQGATVHNCRCYVKSLSAEDLKARGLDAETKGTDLKPDEGWRYNVGEAGMDGGWQPDLDRYAGPLSARFAEDAVRSPFFDRFLEGKTKGAFPVAIVDEAIRDAIGSKTQVVTLSDQTLAKNLDRHPEIGIEDYRKLPQVVREAQLVVQDGDNTFVFLQRDEKLYFGAVKSTRSGEGMFLTSFRLARLSDADAVRRKGKVLRDLLPK